MRPNCSTERRSLLARDVGYLQWVHRYRVCTIAYTSHRVYYATTIARRHVLTAHLSRFITLIF